MSSRRTFFGCYSFAAVPDKALTRAFAGADNRRTRLTLRDAEGRRRRRRCRTPVSSVVKTTTPTGTVPPAIGVYIVTLDSLVNVAEGAVNRVYAQCVARKEWKGKKRNGNEGKSNFSLGAESERFRSRTTARVSLRYRMGSVHNQGRICGEGLRGLQPLKVSEK